jgi:hypothetical protein
LGPEWKNNRSHWLDILQAERISIIRTLIHVGASIAVLLVSILAFLDPQDPAILQIRVLEGDGAVYGLGARATRGVTVQVTDETGKPVDGAAVSFRLPESGPTGNFATGAKTEIATTRSDGRAGVWGMQWNRTAGAFEIRVTAVKGQSRAGTVCPQYLTDSPAVSSSTARLGPGHSHKWLWILAGIGGAAAAGIAVTAAGGKAAATTPSTGVTIGTPTIILGHP